MDAFTLAAKLTLDSADFETGLATVENNAQSQLTSSMVAIGNLAGAAIKSSISSLVRFAKQAVMTGAEFDAMMSKVQAHGKLTNEQTEQVRQRAKELGETTAFTAAEVGEAFDYMAFAGWDVDEMLKGIDAILNLAAASGEDLGRTSDIVTDALTAFGMTASDAGHFANLLAVASTSANTNVGLMGETFKYVASVGGALHISAEDTAEAIGLIANAGIKGSQAGTSLANIISRIATDAGASEKTLGALGIIQEKLGVQVYTAEGKFRDFGDIINDCREAWQGLSSDQEKADFAKQIASQRGLAAWFALMNAGVDDVEKLRKELENSDGAAAEMSEKMLDNLKGDLTILNSAVEGLKILVSDEYKGSLRSFVTEFTEEIGRMGEAFESGGVAGMFKNLTNWLIGGMTDALSNPEITEKDAQDFGRGLGDFVGDLVQKLVTNMPTIVTGLFTAGANLASGLIEGLFNGLFGTGEGSIPGILRNVQDTEQDAINQADATATQAQGIVAYMESLVSKYGEAATETEGWASSLEKLEQLIPGITSQISAEGDALNTTTANLKEYIEQSRAKAIEDAKQAAIGDLRQRYTNAQVEAGRAEINASVASYEMQEAIKGLAAYVARDGVTNANTLIEQFNAGTLGIDQLAFMARQTANSLGESQDYVSTLISTYQQAQSTYNENTAKIGELTSAAAMLQTQLNIAEAAVARMAEEAASFTVPTFGGGEDGSNAKGAWNVPHDNYVSLLHRGEMVLTASQAREYREGRGSGGGSGLTADEIATIARAAVSDLAMQLNRETVGRVFGDATTERVSDNMTKINSSRRYGYGG